jgi:hypothetical protein
MDECAGEGAEGAELAKQAVELMRELKQERVLLQPLRNALNRTPPARMEEANPYWAEMAALLRDLLTDLGDKPGALALQNQMDALKAKARH